jgi:hypothetical protein
VISLPVEYSAFKLLLAYLYEDSISLETTSLELLKELLLLATQYGVTRLAEICEVGIAKSITVTNVVEWLLFVDQMGECKTLRNYCMCIHRIQDLYYHSIEIILEME